MLTGYGPISIIMMILCMARKKTWNSAKFWSGFTRCPKIYALFAPSTKGGDCYWCHY